jgi:medium-chain acyl-[acyl-carrier-protein] hydrolase
MFMKTTSDFDFWVTCPKPNPHARLRLFCFPYAGGSALIFRNWWDDLPSAIEVCPIQLPGRASRLGEPSFSRLSPLIQALEGVIRPYLDLPFAFFGHSMGALISFELARQLRRQSVSNLVYLFISARRAPQIPDRYPPIYRLPESSFVEKLLSRYNGIPESVMQSAELMQLFLPILRADFEMIETYVYSAEAPLDCPISAFGGLQDSQVTQEDLAAWRDHTLSSFKLQMFPANHFFLHSDRSLLLQAMSQELTEFLN